MADVADRNGKEGEATGETAGLPQGRPAGKPGGPVMHAVTGETGAAMYGRTHFGHFAERVLPTLRRVRAARLAAEALAGGNAAGPAALGRRALDAVRRVDATLRAAGVYDLSEAAAMERDPLRMEAACRLVDQVAARLAELARELDDTLAGSVETGLPTIDREAASRLAALRLALRTPDPRTD